MLMEWRPIEQFPIYSVSNEGLVRNEETGRQMSLLVNQHGVVNVGLTRDCRQYKRAVGLLVATAYLKDKQPNKAFDCPINLDGDRFNNCVDNLAWRPKWFAVQYRRQLEEAHFEDEWPIENVDTHETFRNTWDAARRYGLLQMHILLAIANRSEVWPFRYRFRELR
jgi:hypothetical protein